jgi:hypothetical protein
MNYITINFLKSICTKKYNYLKLQIPSMVLLVIFLQLFFKGYSQERICALSKNISYYYCSDCSFPDGIRFDQDSTKMYKQTDIVTCSKYRYYDKDYNLQIDTGENGKTYFIIKSLIYKSINDSIYYGYSNPQFYNEKNTEVNEIIDFTIDGQVYYPEEKDIPDNREMPITKSDDNKSILKTDSSIKNSSKKLSINKSEILDKRNYLCVVKHLNVQNANGEYELIPFDGDKSFLITKKYVYEIDHSNLINKWRIKNVIDDGVDIHVINTYDGTQFSLEEFLVKALPSGEVVSYEIEQLPASKVLIKKEYIISNK